MKILSVIPCSKGNSHPYIKQVAKELSLVSDTVIFSPENIEGFNTEITDKNLGHNLVFTPRNYILSKLDDYDYFVYNEDDILINSEILLKAIKVNELISSIDIKYAIGLLRYELDDNQKEYTDLHPDHCKINPNKNKIIKDITELETDKYFTPCNVHSGNFILSKNQIKYLLDLEKFSVTPHSNFVGTLESGASDVYFDLIKLIPINNFTEFECHHLSNKYIYNSRKVTEEELNSLLDG